MKKTILIYLAVALLISAAACGKQQSNVDSSQSGNVSSQTDSNSSQEVKSITATNSQLSSDTDSSSDEKKSSDKKSSDTEKSSDTDSAKKAASSATSSSKTTSNNTSHYQGGALPIDYYTSSAAGTVTTEVPVEQPTENAPATDNSQPEPTVSSEPEQTVNTFEPSDLVFKVNNNEINLDDDIEDVQNRIGKADDVITAPSCMYVGQEDKTFLFDGFTINTYPSEDGSKDYVVGIDVTADNIVTDKGVHVGMSIEDALAVYGEGYTKLGENTYRFADGNKFLQFYVVGDAIDSISYIFDKSN